MSYIGTKRILFVLLCSSVWSLVLSIDSVELHGELLAQLGRDFMLIRFGDQFAVLWAPPPGYTGEGVRYLPDNPVVNGTANVTNPAITRYNENTYNYNYASATVDYRGIMHGEMLGSTSDTHIHTEDVLLNLAYPRIAHWYNNIYHTHISVLYLYTYYLPCQDCYIIIQHFVGNHSGIHLYVGFTQLYGPDNAEQRQNELSNFLNRVGGDLTQVPLPDLCHHVVGVHSSNGNNKRDTSAMCDATMKMLVIAMDFTNGKAQVWFDNFNADYYGWVELLDRNNRRLTWKWTWSKTTDKLTFNTNIQYGAYVAYWKNYEEMIRKSYRWNDCGFGFVELNNLPYNPYYSSRFSIKLTIKDSYPTVMIKKTFNYSPNARDWVMIQSIDQIGTNDYRTWQWVSYLRKEYDYYYYQFSIGYNFADGFRAKYVFYDGKDYRYEGTHDNASPLWTPRGCEGGV